MELNIFGDGQEAVGYHRIYINAVVSGSDEGGRCLRDG